MNRNVILILGLLIATACASTSGSAEPRRTLVDGEARHVGARQVGQELVVLRQKRGEAGERFVGPRHQLARQRQKLAPYAVSRVAPGAVSGVLYVLPPRGLGERLK